MNRFADKQCSLRTRFALGGCLNTADAMYVEMDCRDEPRIIPACKLCLRSLKQWLETGSRCVLFQDWDEFVVWQTLRS